MKYTVTKRYTEDQLDSILDNPHAIPSERNGGFELDVNNDIEIFRVELDTKPGYSSILIGCDDETGEVYLVLENEECFDDYMPEDFCVDTLRELYNALVIETLRQVEL